MYIHDSDSDDCYGNIPQKVEKLLAKRRAESRPVIEKKCSDDLINLCEDTFNTSDVFKKNEVIVVPDSEDKNFDAANLFLSQPIDVPAEITTKRPKRKKASSGIETPIKRGAKRGRGRGAKSGKGKSQSNEVDTSLVLESLNNPPRRSTRASLRIASNTSVDDFAAPLTPKKTNSRRGRGRRRGKNSVTESPVQISSSENSPIHNQASQYSGTSLDHEIALALAFEAQSRGSRSNRGRGRGRRSIGTRSYQYTIPTYSIGNTDEYPDASDNVKLFNNKPQVPASPTVDLDDSINNEELSVKVFWQSTKVVKFNIRKLQKVTQIFDHFVKEEGVSREQLLFTYNDKILRPDDTPESMDYNIARFIDGGIIHSGVTLPQAVTEKPVNVKKGFMLKFQCQKLKKPYEVTVGKEEKLNLAMIKCAEHLELSINSLQFEFDGETIRGNMTPKDLDMESGDCIDVKILNVNK